MHIAPADSANLETYYALTALHTLWMSPFPLVPPSQTILRPPQY